MFYNILGVLIVLQALCLTANARNTSFEVTPKTKAIVVVSVLDQVAFTEADIQSLKRFTKQLLPDHEFIHIVQTIPAAWGQLIAPNVAKEVRESIREQLIEKVKPHHEITHLILMDHGNTELKENSETFFRHFSFFSETEVGRNFQYMFGSLSGRFSDNAFVMLESCLTMCGDLSASQRRVKTLMDFFKIKNGTLFGSYQSMLSVGYEKGYYLGGLKDTLKNPLIIALSLSVGVAINVENIIEGSFNIGTFLLFSGLSDVAIATVFKTLDYYFQGKSEHVNWGYLYKFSNSKLQKVYNLEPYRNKEDLFLNVKPKKVLHTLTSCSSLFH